MATRLKLWSGLTLFTVLASTACSTARKNQEAEELRAQQMDDIRAQIRTLANRMDSMESKLVSINTKLESTQASLTPPIETTQVKPSAIDHAGTRVESSIAATDPKAGFVNDSAVQTFKKGMILYRAQKYAEAVTTFNQFLQNYADHALAGSAQYYVGESYFQQKDYKSALQEYRKVLTSYDRSPRVPEALARMAESEEQLNLNDDASKHRKILSTFFPNSPAVPALKEASHTAAANKAAAHESQAPQSPQLHDGQEHEQRPNVSPSAPANTEEKTEKPQAYQPEPISPNSETLQAQAQEQAPAGNIDQPPPPTAPFPKSEAAEGAQ